VDAFEEHFDCAQVSRRMEGRQRMADGGFEPFAGWKVENVLRMETGQGRTGYSVWPRFDPKQ
jgi:hypothetical protein